MIPFWRSLLLRLAVAVLGAACLLGPAAADPVEDFYRGKQIKIYIRAAITTSIHACSVGTSPASCPATRACCRSTCRAAAGW
jgi:hypothetical protein